MNAHLIRIGNSQGIRIPKAIIEQIGLTREQGLELEVIDGAIVIRAQHAPRNGWHRAASQCHDDGEDQLDDWDNTNADFAGAW